MNIHAYAMTVTLIYNLWMVSTVYIITEAQIYPIQISLSSISQNYPTFLTFIFIFIEYSTMV